MLGSCNGGRGGFMSNPVCFLSSSQLKADSWPNRIRENFQQLFIPSRLAPTSANGAAFHLMSFAHTKREGGAQTASLVTHGVAVGAILLVALHTGLPQRCPDCAEKPSGPITYTAP